MTLYLVQRLDFCEVYPITPSLSIFPVSVGVKLAIFIFFCLLPSECGSVLLVWQETMRTRQGFVVAEMHF